MMASEDNQVQAVFEFVVGNKTSDRLDTLIGTPPRSLTDDLSLIEWVNTKVDLLKRLFLS